ncbi:bifunctional 3-(3-hydroxy-phenyl)propionate/3-hydroxycinnamic acid hydroxylase [Caballeronia sp. LP006]|uniref:bifunctional 3-(3-hydroxy-phenyl)propionate/3-hydroxycinnamic acid hydroxylase MhpA n=1 Tax=Caballeronia sp. LP006 TaxID=3038552 RepID=UPI0028603150|nr:bifunctional 3-(3-hydroxy-phenyl)propionate/3-hydroxycinnamic acid hydroxylase [Caballeronia sp. LP006]MDR5832215.1 bifunctional 3-(3-hydroxy-phenyl)propionate/3-hydroxycinnamic acid hydroxylase [Caballeronia sp. LP006]
MTANDEQFDVVVVGFGPSGAVAAGLLGQKGIRTLCVDRAKEVYDKPRAIAVDHEIMRVFQGMGVADRVMKHVAAFPASEFYGVDGRLIKRIDTVPQPYPLGYTPTMVFTQPPVEAALREHAASYPSVEVALGTELAGFSEEGDSVHVELRAEDGGIRRVTCGYLIGCDGASSTVRASLGIAYEDLEFDEPWLVVDVKVNERGLAKLPKTAIQYCEPSRPCTYIVGPGGHRRWEIMLQEDEDPAHMQQAQQVWKLLERWMTPEDGELWRAASYRFHALVAKAWRRGRVFIAGDAAHQQPPFIGQGMCQGIRDVTNLIWKLDAVMRGAASDALLDSYETERKAHVRELTTRIKALGRVICERDTAAACARDQRLIDEAGGTIRTVTRQEIVPGLRDGMLSGTAHPANGTLFPQPRVRDDATVKLLDEVIGGGWRVVVADPSLVSDGARARAAELGVHWSCLQPNPRDAGFDGQVVQETEGVLAGWFEKHQCGAAIVRPDHYVYGVSSDAALLAGQLDDLSATLR